MAHSSCVLYWLCFIASVKAILQFDEITTETFDELQIQMGWIKILSCSVSTHDPSFNDYGRSSDELRNLSSNAISLRIIPPGGKVDALYNELAVIAKPCTNPIFSLNHHKELSYTVDKPSGNIASIDTDFTNWIGTSNALARLKTRCGYWSDEAAPGGHPWDFPDVIYDTCDTNGIRISPAWNFCDWEYSYAGRDIEIHLGFAVNQTIQCNFTRTQQKAPRNISTITTPIRKNTSKCNDPSNAQERLQNTIYDETTNSDSYDIGWIQLISCIHGRGNNLFTMKNGYDIESIEELLPYVLAVRIAPPKTSAINNYNDFMIETKPCSNAVFSINNGNEMTWTVDPFTGKIKDDNNTIEMEWNGSHNAKQRLHSEPFCNRYLGIEYPRGFPYIYSTCGNGINIDMNSGTCLWNASENIGTGNGETINIYFGFDVNGIQRCQYELDQINITKSVNYTFVPYAMNALDAAVFCEKTLGNTLAHITNNKQIEQVLNLRYTLGLDKNDMWIGLHKSYGDNYHSWKWFGGGNTQYSCEYTGYNDCLFDSRWVDFQPPFGAYESQTAAICTNQICNNVNTYISLPSSEEKQFICDNSEQGDAQTISLAFCNVSVSNELNIGYNSLFIANITVGTSNKITFEIKLNEDYQCLGSRCNLFFVGTQQLQGLPSMFIRDNGFDIYFQDESTEWYADRVDNILDVLCDGNFHKIDLFFSTTQRKYSIDDQLYFLEEKSFQFITYVGKQLPLYIGAPWENALDATIQNFCFQADIDMELQKVTWQRMIEIPFHALTMSVWNDKIIFLSDLTHLYGGQESAFGFVYAPYDIPSVAESSSLFRNYPVTTTDTVDFGEVIMDTQWSRFVVKSIQDNGILYVIAPVQNNDFSCGLFEFNLTELSLKTSMVIPNTSHSSNSCEYCMASDTKYVYIINGGIILYDKNSGNFVSSSIIFGLFKPGCATVNDDGILFIFGGSDINYGFLDTIFAYDSFNDSIQLLSAKLQQPAEDIFAIPVEDKIYLTGFSDAAQIEIFDTYTNQFIAKQSIIYIDMLDPAELIMSSLFDSQSQLILKLVNYETNDIYTRYSGLDYMVVQYVAVDFNHTSNYAWRDKVNIKYTLAGYTKYDGLYNFEIKYQNSTENVIRYIFLDHIDDICFICSEEDWSIYCNNQCYISITDTQIDEINVTIKPMSTHNIRMLNEGIMTIQFLKCNIEFTAQTLSTNRLSFKPDVADICAGNPMVSEQYGYITYINGTDVDINHIIIINITYDNNATQIISCTVCTNTDSTCYSCQDGIDINVTSNFNGTFMIYPFSQTTDLVVTPSQIEVQYNPPISSVEETKVPLQTWQLLLIIFGVLLFVCVLIILYMVRVKNKKLQEQVKYQQEQTQIISNPLVISIGVGFYDENPETPGVDLVFKNLDGVDVDQDNIKILCESFNYDMNPKFKEYAKLEWTQTDILKLFKQCVEKAMTNDYDAILAMFSGHGFKHNFITSDYQAMNKDAIIRYFSCYDKKLRSIPKIFFFDCCDGERERSVGAGEISDSDSDSGKHATSGVNDNYDLDEEKLEQKDSANDVGKNLDIQHLNNLDLDQQLIENEANANYKVAVIHAANSGFQSKLNSTDGSYLLNAFIRRMIENLDMNNEEFLGDMMQHIQDKLHTEMGKQQTVHLFNDNTRYIKFVRNEKSCIDNDQESSTIDKRKELSTKSKDDQLTQTIDITQMEEILNDIAVEEVEMMLND